ncbi:MAG: hypothetical protein GY866_37485 [Proteobacteria bacterium]|nr:hypothetical protein [Pseudomonadota bacterium]
MEIQLSPSRNKTDTTIESLEDYLTKSLYEENVQRRIKQQLQNILREELSKMSLLLKNALRDWIFKEKQKADLDSKQQQKSPTTEKLVEYQKKNKELENENERLKRQMKLKEHENQIVLEGLKKMMESKKK